MRAFAVALAALWIGSGSVFAEEAKKEEAKAKKPVTAVEDDEATEAIKTFKDAYKASMKTKEEEALLEAVYMLHDVPHDAVIKQLERLLRHRSVAVRNVAAMALGGQGHNKTKAGTTLMKALKSNYKKDEVVSATLDAMSELGYMKYWPYLKLCLDDDRNAVAIRALDLIGANQDWRAVPELLKMYKEAIPKGYKWETGEVTVDTGTAGDADQKAAEAKFNAKYGQGGSKAKAKAKAKANAGKERNLATQLRRCVRKLTGQDFETVLDFEDWLMENWVDVARKAAVLSGKNPNAAAKKARSELPAMKKKIEEEREKMEKRVASERKARGD